MTKDLKNLIDNIYQLAMNSRDTDAIIRMIGIIHAVDEELLVLTKERDDSRWWAKKAIDEIIEERDEARQQVKNIKNGFEGCCNACEPVGEMNKKLREERDEARREVCESEKYCKEEAKSRGWDCYKETP